MIEGYRAKALEGSYVSAITVSFGNSEGVRRIGQIEPHLAM